MNNNQGDKRASIIIVTYNGAAYLEQCLASVQQDIGSADEVIIVDNASTDGSANLVQQLWPEVRLVHNNSNLGFAVANNQGANYAHGKYLVFLNQDTRVLPGWLNGLINAVGQNDRVALSTSKMILMFQPDMLQGCGLDLHFSGLGYSRGLMKSADECFQAKAIGAVCGGAFAVRRDVWTKLRGFDEEFFAYYEDTDLSWRAQLMGYKSFCAPSSIVYHDLNMNLSTQALYYTARNRSIMLLKNWRWSTLVLLMPGLVLAELVEWGYMTLIGWPGIQAKLRAWGWLLTNIYKVNILRRSSQVIRQVPDWVILENRTWTLKATVRTGGPVGRVLTTLANVLLFTNGWAARRICRLFGW